MFPAWYVSRACEHASSADVPSVYECMRVVLESSFTLLVVCRDSHRVLLCRCDTRCMSAVYVIVYVACSNCLVFDVSD